MELNLISPGWWGLMYEDIKVWNWPSQQLSNDAKKDLYNSSRRTTWQLGNDAHNSSRSRSRKDDLSARIWSSQQLQKGDPMVWKWLLKKTTGMRITRWGRLPLTRGKWVRWRMIFRLKLQMWTYTPRCRLSVSSTNHNTLFRALRAMRAKSFAKLSTIEDKTLPKTLHYVMLNSGHWSYWPTRRVLSFHARTN